MFGTCQSLTPRRKELNRYEKPFSAVLRASNLYVVDMN